MDIKNRTNISIILWVLVILDVSIAIIAFFFPDFWFKLFHGAPYIDPQGFLRRCGANWAAFALIQIIASFKWVKKSYWLAVVAGVRFSDIFTDWTYLWFCSNITVFGWLSLFLISPINLLLGLYFLRAYKLHSQSSLKI